MLIYEVLEEIDSCLHHVLSTEENYELFVDTRQKLY